MNQNIISGVTISDLKIISDNRGSVLHMLRNDSPKFTQFGECYFSEVLPGVVKAWKRHKIQTQNITVPIGRIQIVIYDNRDTSETRNQIMSFEVGRPDRYILVTIPSGLWYGFKGLGDTVSLLANCADHPHEREESEILHLNDSIIPYVW